MVTTAAHAKDKIIFATPETPLGQLFSSPQGVRYCKGKRADVSHAITACAHTRSHLPRAGHTSIEEHGTKHGRVIISRYNRKVKKCISPITNNSRELTASRRLKYSSQKRTLCERVHSDGNRYCVVRYIEDLHGVEMDSQRPMSTSDFFIFCFYPSYTRTFSPCALAHCQATGCIHYCTNIPSSNLM